MIGVTPAAVGNWESERKRPSPLALMALGNLAGDEKDWWFAQAGDQYALVEQTVDSVKRTYAPDEETNRTRLMFAHAGAGPNRFPPQEANGKINVPRAWFAEGQSACVLPVVDEAMAPVIPRGSLVFVDPHDHADLDKLAGKIVAVRHPEGVRVGQLQQRADGPCVVFQNAGPEYTAVPVVPARHTLVGRVLLWIAGPAPISSPERTS